MATSSSQNRGTAAKSRNVATNLLGAIPMTDQTDPRKFPPYEHIEFPKMMLQEDGKPYMDKASGEPIVVLDADEECEFREENPDALDIANMQQGSALSRAEREELDNLRKMRDNLSDAGDGDKGSDEQPSEPNKLTGAVASRRPVSAARRLTGKDGAPLPKKLD